MLLYGIPFIDIEEWKEHTEYEKPYDSEHKV